MDPLWKSYVPGGIVGGNLWFPHEYMPNENPFDPRGYIDMGRWDYGPWMLPPMVVQNTELPSPTAVPEAFMDTMIVNGTAFPYVELPPTAVRFRILNACNDRMLNLQLYKAEPLTVRLVNGGSRVRRAGRHLQRRRCQRAGHGHCNRGPGDGRHHRHHRDRHRRGLHLRPDRDHHR